MEHGKGVMSGIEIFAAGGRHFTLSLQRKKSLVS
jgi:hypothetical protein